MAEIKVALAGVGNCASGLIQGLKYYGNCEKEEESLGLRHLYLGGFHPKDIQIVAAFDVDSRKVGKDLSQAIFAEPNNAPKIVDVPQLDVTVQKGPVLDGVGEYTRKVIQISSQSEVDVKKVLEESGAEILLNLLPSGAIEASKWYAEQALSVGCAFVNATPVFIASDRVWAGKFEDAGLPVVGDDLLDQVGATTLHKTLLKLLSMHGVRITETYQLDVGGGTESLDTLERTRDVKRTVKTRSVEAALPYRAEVVAGSMDYVDFLNNRRDSYFWIRGLYFCNTPMQIDLKLSTVDAPNAGSVLFDVIRAVKIALDRRLKGAILPICAYAFKNPPQLFPIETAEKMFFDFIAERHESEKVTL
ncbi:MAG: inositol-3-phosphate synthase [Candidatus Bathyarchaeia archaeon]|nr:MAG: inositol-3-phosphate synthase [Candidatus Bathyarchaeota archaeon]